VISVDTAAAHLRRIGGAGVVVLSAVGEWRGCLTERISPWYPTMRLFGAGNSARGSGLPGMARVLAARPITTKFTEDTKETQSSMLRARFLLRVSFVPCVLCGSTIAS